MENRNDLMQAKKTEIEHIISNSIIKLSPDSNLHVSEIKDSLFNDGYITITSPQQEAPTMKMMILDPLKNFQRGESIKPGNIKLNIRKLIESLPEITSSCVGLALDIPILKVCAALNIWKVLRNAMAIEIDKRHAIVITALWENCNNKHIIRLEHGFECVNLLCRKLSETEFEWEKYIQIVEQLQKNDNIKLNNDSIWMCEWVSKKYTR